MFWKFFKWMAEKFKYKEGVTYNHADNLVMVKSEGDLIYVICNNEKQMEKAVEKLSNDNCVLCGYEEWDVHTDMKLIVTFKVLDDNEMKPEYN